MAVPMPASPAPLRELPAPPQAALRILGACNAEDVDGQRLGALVSSDPALAAAVLRLVNSPFFGLGRPVTSISHGVTVLGRRALRNFVLCVAVRDALRPALIPGLDTDRYWTGALHRAVSARLLGERLRAPVDECFTAGLLLDIGLLCLFYERPEHAGLWPSFAGSDPEERYRLEWETFGTTHDEAGRRLAAHWGLPEALVEVIGGHHGEPRAPGAGAAMLRVARAADWLGAIPGAAEPHAVAQRCRRLLADEWSMDDAAADALLGSLAAGVAEAAPALGLGGAPQASAEQLMREANLRLVQENLSYQELTRRLEGALEERDRFAAEIRHELEKARVMQRSLLPGQPEDGCPFAGVNLPARALSGDFFDFFPMADGRYWFNLADVAGKGVDAALMMAKTSSLFRCLAKWVTDPGKLLSLINREICELSSRGMFVTLVGGIYDPARGAVRMVNAGAPPPLLWRGEGECVPIPAGAPPLGVLPETVFPVVEHVVTGAALYLFTDGLIEAPLADSDERLGFEGALALIRRHAGLPRRERVVHIVTGASGGQPTLRDDISLLVLEG